MEEIQVCILDEKDDVLFSPDSDGIDCFTNAIFSLPDQILWQLPVSDTQS